MEAPSPSRWLPIKSQTCKSNHEGAWNEVSMEAKSSPASQGCSEGATSQTSCPNCSQGNGTAGCAGPWQIPSSWWAVNWVFPALSWSETTLNASPLLSQLQRPLPGFSHRLRPHSSNTSLFTCRFFPRGFLWDLDFSSLAGTGDAVATWDPLPTNPGLKEDVGRERATRLLSGCALDGPVAVSCLS